MLNNPTVEKLKDMKLKVMAQMLSEPDNELKDLSFEERLGIMVEKEWLAKKNARIKKLLSSAPFGINACVEDIDYSTDRGIDKKVIQTLSKCTYIEQKLNMVITGKTGSGKTYLACAFGNAACRLGYTVKYYRIPELLLEIQNAKTENKYFKLMTQLQKYKLLILDDIGLKSYTLEESRDIHEIIERRHNKTSTILAGQIPHEKWFELFPDPTIADAIMDRLIHIAFILSLNAKKSMREVMAGKFKQTHPEYEHIGKRESN
jgi:DNA replication protein DnaC